MNEIIGTGGTNQPVGPLGSSPVTFSATGTGPFATLSQQQQTTLDLIQSISAAQSVLRPPPISLQDFFTGIATPQRILLQVAKAIDLQNATLRIEYQLNNVTLMQALFQLYDESKDQYEQDKQQFVPLQNAEANFEAIQVNQAKTAQATFNAVTITDVANPPINDYNDAVNQLRTDLNNGVPYATAAANYNTAIAAYNQRAQTYNGLVSDFNDSIANYNAGLQDVQTQVDATNAAIDVINQRRATEHLPPIAHISSVLGNAAAPLSDLPIVPPIDPVQQPATLPSTIFLTGNYTPSNINFGLATIATIITSANYQQDFQRSIQQLAIAINAREAADQSYDDQDPVSLALQLLRQGKVFNQDPTDIGSIGYIRDPGTLNSAAGSIGLVGLTLGIGNSNLESAMSRLLLQKTVENALLDLTGDTLGSNLLGDLIQSSISQLATKEFLGGIVPAVALLISSGLSLEPNGTPARAAAAVQTVNPLLTLVLSGNLQKILQELIQSSPSLQSLTPDQLASIQNASNFALLTASLGTLIQGIGNSSQIQQEFFFNLVGGASPALLPTSRLDLYKQNFDVPESLKAIVNLFQQLPTTTQEVVQNAITQSFEEILAAQGVPPAELNPLANQLYTEALTAAANQEDVASALQQEASLVGIVNSQALNQQVIPQLTQQFTNGLLVARFGEVAANALQFGQNNQELLGAADQLRRVLFGNQPFSQEIIATLEKASRIATDVAQTLSAIGNRRDVENLITDFQNFQAISNQPQVFLEELLNPAKTFIGVMYEGTRHHYERGDGNILKA